ncbi:MAG: RraA family protein [Candidatus Atribacteria bacterium]|nr:RraA family protein [Candidatus Atribacteria bacterium]
MSKMNDKTKEMFKKLLNYNTPTVGNVVATYPGNPSCLGLYDNWYGKWYTSQKVKCVFPEKGRRIGFAVTLVFSLQDPNKKSYSFLDLIDALGQAEKPIIVVAQQKFPEDIADSVGLFGGQMTSLLQASGVVGVVTDGPSRDLDEMREMDVQYIMSGATPGHGDFVLSEINTKVTVAGMEVDPGDVIHMDEHGATKFPIEKLADICENIKKFSQEEDQQSKAILKAKTVEELKKAWSERV